jgi:hypothetical protein
MHADFLLGFFLYAGDGEDMFLRNASWHATRSFIPEERERSSRHDFFQHTTSSYISKGRALHVTTSSNALSGALSQKRELLTARFQHATFNYISEESSSRFDLFQHATRSFISEERALNGTISFNALRGAVSQERELFTARPLSTRYSELYLRREGS